MITDPLTGARKPEQTDGPLGGLQIANAVDDLAQYTVPRFDTTGQRDTAYADWLAAGGVLEDGMMCTVAGVLHKRESGAWVPYGTRQAACRFTAAQPGGSIPANTLWGAGAVIITDQRGGTFAASSDRVTVPVAGLYHIVWSVGFDTTFSPRSYLQVAVGSLTYRQPFGGPGESIGTLSTVASVTAGQQVLFQTSTNHTTGLAGASSHGFLVRIGDAF